jgi:hypothetical protein
LKLAATLPQDDIYRQNFYLSLMEFRELTLQRLKKFVDQRFFSVFDYLEGPRQHSLSSARLHARTSI